MNQCESNNVAVDTDEPLGNHTKGSVTSAGSVIVVCTGPVCTSCNYSSRPYCKNPEETFRKHKKRQQLSPLANLQSLSTQFLHVCCFGCPPKHQMPKFEGYEWIDVAVPRKPARVTGEWISETKEFSRRRVAMKQTSHRCPSWVMRGTFGDCTLQGVMYKMNPLANETPGPHGVYRKEQPRCHNAQWHAQQRPAARDW